MISFNISILFLIILIGIGVQSIHFPEHVVDNYGHPKYKFDYTVSDPHTGDHKHQWEHRDGGHVQGAYSFLESDGTTRIVEYKSAPHIGFHAKIRKIGHATHPHPHEYQHHF